MSISRMDNWNTDNESMVNKQINLELTASHIYLYLSTLVSIIAERIPVSTVPEAAYLCNSLSTRLQSGKYLWINSAKTKLNESIANNDTAKYDEASADFIKAKDTNNNNKFLFCN